VGNKILIFLFLLSVFLTSFLPVKDTDFGWHYRCGEEFINSGKLCLENNYSYFLPKYQAYNPSFLYDIGLAFVYDHFGFLGISIAGGIVMVLAAYIFLNLSRVNLWQKFAAFYLIYFLSSTVFAYGLRSQSITYLFFLLSFFLIHKARISNRRYLLFFPLLFLIWVNTHIGFFIGFFVMGILSLTTDKKFIFRYILPIFILSLSATFINPFGTNVYKGIFNHAISPLNEMIAEWTPPPFFYQQILILISSFITVFLLIKQKKFSLFAFLPILFFCILAMQARRNLPFFYTVFFYVLFNYLNFNSAKYLNELIMPVVMSLIFLLLVIHVPQTLYFNRSWNEYCNHGMVIYPCEAIRTYSKLSGNVFNTYEWGGFLIWQKPQIKVFVDGRMPAWRDENGKSPYQVFLEIWYAQTGWNDRLKKWKTDYILIKDDTPLDLLLKNKKEQSKYHWYEVYRGSDAVIYKYALSN
jgi:hypothetical protein